MPAGMPDLTSRIGVLEHRVDAIRAALAATTLSDEVRLVLHEHLRVAEDALQAARRATAA